VTTKIGETVLKNFVNGKWVESSTEQFQDVVNPATGEVIAKVPISTFEDLNEAVATAKEAYKTWGKTPVPKRARIVGVPAPMAFFPFSGYKNSFFGDLHANGKDGVQFYTRKKMITSRF
jgi:acyl-CoA reductase-like NAD-dependent aldehyde dehydrogenase